MWQSQLVPCVNILYVATNFVAVITPKFTTVILIFKQRTTTWDSEIFFTIFGSPPLSSLCIVFPSPLSDWCLLHRWTAPLACRRFLHCPPCQCQLPSLRRQDLRFVCVVYNCKGFHKSCVVWEGSHGCKSNIHLNTQC